MNYQDALKAYHENPTSENLHKQAKALVAEMTLNEKIHMLTGKNFMQVMLKGYLSERRVYNIDPITSGDCKRLGIKNGLKFTDGPRGIVMGHSTCFPVAMLRGATFDTELEKEIAYAMADEALAQGANYFAGICINLVRHPKWGRCQESYGEDQYLLGEMGVTDTQAVQEKGMIACPKHFALNSIEDLRFYIDARVEDRALYEVYLPHFKKCIDAGALSIMGAYNKVNGEYSCANQRLLTEILRKEWGFDGFVISDFVWGVTDAQKCINAGLDIEMPQKDKYSKLKKLIRSGKVKEETINKSVAGILRVMMQVEGKAKPVTKEVITCEKHVELARRAAREGMVLLENNGVLPLDATKKIAVCGEYANAVNVGDHGSSSVHSPYYITAYEGIRNRFTQVTLAEGEDIEKILEKVEDSSVVIVNVGFDYCTEGEFVINPGENAKSKKSGTGGDRSTLHISAKDVQLIKSLKENGKKVVVILYSGGAVITEEFREYCDAIIMNFYAGMEGGNALADILSGDANPCGKMPMTVAKNECDYPDFKHIGERPYEIDYGYYHGYAMFEKEKRIPRYEFGYGLSYTRFVIDNLTVEVKDQIEVSVDVENVGDLGGKEVVQVYAGSMFEGEDRPVKQLKGFKKIFVDRGCKTRITIGINKDDLKFYNAQKKHWVLDPAYRIYVGNSAVTANDLFAEIEFV